MRWRTACLLVVGLALTGCQYPRDPDNTLRTIRNEGVLRVGVTVSPPWVDEAGADPRGREIDLVEQFARTRLGDPEIEWVDGSEADHVEALEKGELDLVVGGWEKRTPYRKQVSITRPYAGKQHVMVVPLGENALLVELERFLHEESGL